jgi:hypothetical protein
MDSAPAGPDRVPPPDGSRQSGKERGRRAAAALAATAILLSVVGFFGLFGLLAEDAGAPFYIHRPLFSRLFTLLEKLWLVAGLFALVCAISAWRKGRHPRGKFRGGGLVWSALVVSILYYPASFLACSLAPLSVFVVSHVSRTNTDLRSLATAIEAYNLDNDSYPVWSVDAERNAFLATARGRAVKNQPTFTLWSAREPDLMTLTTPVSYITSLGGDAFSPACGFLRKAPFCYYAPARVAYAPPGWILWSAGPDLDYDITMDSVARAYDVTTTQPSLVLLTEFTHDPTNGAKSDGDIWRVRQ